jgi:flagellar hook assembly protein FlgD
MLSPRGGGFSSQTEISFVLGRSAAASVQIFDMTGHLVREVVRATTLSPGSNVATWDGRDQDGRIVYDGAYVVLVQAGGQRAKKIVTVVNGQR